MHHYEEATKASGDGGSLDPKFESVLRECLSGLIDPQMPLSMDTDLAAHGFESITLVRIMVAVEEAFHVCITDHEVRFELFATPATLWAAVVRSRAGSHGC